MRPSIVIAVILCSLATLRGSDRRAIILERSAKLDGFLGETIPQPGWASYLADDTLAHSTQELMQQAEGIAGWFSASFRPRTSVMTSGCLLKISSPRETEHR